MVPGRTPWVEAKPLVVENGRRGRAPNAIAAALIAERVAARRAWLYTARGPAR